MSSSVEEVKQVVSQSELSKLRGRKFEQHRLLKRSSNNTNKNKMESSAFVKAAAEANIAMISSKEVDPVPSYLVESQARDTRLRLADISPSQPIAGSTQFKTTLDFFNTRYQNQQPQISETDEKQGKTEKQARELTGRDSDYNMMLGESSQDQSDEVFVRSPMKQQELAFPLARVASSSSSDSKNSVRGTL